MAWLAFSASIAWAQDHITERAWMEDASRQMSWSEVQRQNLQPFTGTLNKGFGHSVIWLRLRVDPNLAPKPARMPEQLVLRIRPVYLDDVRVLDPLSPDDSSKVTGDIHPPSQDELQSLDLLLPIPRGNAPRDIWLRLDSTSTRQIDVQALNEDTLRQSALNQSLVFAGYLALVFLLAVWGIVHWLFSRDRLIGAFSIKQIAALLFALCSLGYLRALWPSNWPIWLINQATNAFSITAVTAAILFHVLLIREFKPPPWIQRLHLILLALFPVKLVLLMLGWPVAALRINMSEVLLSPLIFLTAVLLAKGWRAHTDNRPALSRALAIGFYSALLALLAMAALPGLGITKGHEIGLYIVQVHGLVTAFLVLLMLQYRGHIMRKKQQEIAMALDLSQMQAKQERTIRQEQEKLLAMLAHELKTPLATIHMRLDTHASGSRQIKQAIRDMNGVIERCQQTAQLDDRQIVPHLQAVDLKAMVHDAVSSCAHPERIDLTLPTHLLWVQTDPQLLPIVLNNLLENACKYAAPNTPIQIRLTPATHSVTTGWTLEISNEAGPAGWPDADKVFEKYYRSPHARRQTGSGLGLYLVHHLMQKLGGLIDYSPTQNSIRFILSLPANPIRTST
jgi:signal transduction histidine kinase